MRGDIERKQGRLCDTHTDILNIDKQKTKEKEIENFKGGIEKDTKQKFIRNMNTYKC